MIGSFGLVSAAAQSQGLLALKGEGGLSHGGTRDQDHDIDHMVLYFPWFSNGQGNLGKALLEFDFFFPLPMALAMTPPPVISSKPLGFESLRTI